MAAIAAATIQNAIRWRRRLAVITKRIQDLNRMRRVLEGLVRQCENGKRPRACPIIATLTKD